MTNDSEDTDDLGTNTQTPAKKELSRVLYILAADVANSRQALKTLDTEFDRRTYVRTVFSFVEGVVHRLKLSILDDWIWFYDVSGADYSDDLRETEQLERKNSPILAMRALLLEESYELRNGKPKVIKKNIPFEDNIKFTFGTFMSFNKKQGAIDYTGEGWHCFQKAYKIRNRLMHPKSTADLFISDEDIVLMDRGLDWILEGFESLLDIQIDLEAVAASNALPDSDLDM